MVINENDLNHFSMTFLYKTSKTDEFPKTHKSGIAKFTKTIFSNYRL